MIDNSYLEQLKDICKDIKDVEVKKYVEDIIESGEWFAYEVDYPEDLDNFDGFFEGCSDSLDSLLGEDEVARALDLRDLYEEHFGNMIATEYKPEMVTINEAVINCLMNMVYDYLYDNNEDGLY